MSESKTSVKIKSPKNTNTIFGLPAKSYTDNEFWDKECETVLADGLVQVKKLLELNLLHLLEKAVEAERLWVFMLNNILNIIFL